jgi:predicted outer membrane repeat protein
MRQIKILSVVAAFALSGSAVFAADRLVPSQYPTIQVGIDAAVDGDTVVVDPNTYYENIDFGGKSITLTSTDPNDPNVVASTTIDANGSGTVVTFPDAENANCVLAGFTITSGHSSSSGGGICCWDGTIAISNCAIMGNSASDGGGIFNDHADLTLANCTFIANVARDVHGGGILNLLGNLMLTDCTFSENVSVNWSGGGIRSTHGASTLTNCTFIGNSASHEGGGVATDYNSVTLANCTFNGNSAWVGGAMVSSHFGAAATNCTFSGNSAALGGAILTSGLYLGDLTLSNCTFSGNVADARGGAIYNWNGGNLILTNCVLWGNSANEGPQIAVQANWNLSISHSCLQGGQLDIYTGYEGTLNWGDGNIEDDPCFVDADGSDNVVGTEDDNLRLMPGSPCIDEGNNVAVRADIADLDNDGNTSERTPLDLDNGSRFIDDPNSVDSGVPDPPDYNDIVDLGAYEYLSNTCWDAAECAGQASGDATCDGSVNLGDLFALKFAFGNSAPWTGPECCADFNHDDSVNLGDLFILKAGFGSSVYGPSSGSQDCPP